VNFVPPEEHTCEGPKCKGLMVIKTKSGRKALVAKGAANPFAKLIAWLEHQGYEIKAIGGYSYRRIAGTRSLSNHARAAAIDINQSRRNVVSRPFPPGTTAMARKLGLRHGAVWGSPDTGHFELIESKKYAVIRKKAARRYASL
jgi:hypothetical protein